MRPALTAAAAVAMAMVAGLSAAQAPAAVPDRVVVDQAVVVPVGDAARPALHAVPAPLALGGAVLDAAAAAECGLRPSPLACNGGAVRFPVPLDPAMLGKEVKVPVYVPGTDGLVGVAVLGALVSAHVLDVGLLGVGEAMDLRVPQLAGTHAVAVVRLEGGQTMTVRFDTYAVADLARELLPQEVALGVGASRVPWALLREAWSDVAPRVAAHDAARVLPGALAVPLKGEMAPPAAPLPEPPALAPAPLGGPAALPDPLALARLLPEAGTAGFATPAAPSAARAGAAWDQGPAAADVPRAPVPAPAPSAEGLAAAPPGAPPGGDPAAAHRGAPSAAASLLAEPGGRALAGVLVGAGLVWPLWMLYRRVQQARALENPHRRSILDRIVASPGVTPGELRSSTGLHYTSCLHHVRVLEDLGFIEVRRLSGQLRCFENHSRYGATEARLLAAGRGSTTRGLLREVLRQPGVTPAEVARTLGLARSSVKHHVDRLAAWGVLEAQPDGPHVRLRVAPGAVDALVALLSR